ncbi:MAG: hypothetical protein ACK5HP_02515 [Bacilli bacterium]
MKFIKKHKLLTITILIILIIGIGVFIFVKQFMPDLTISEYGKRLNNIDDYPISETVVKTLISDINNLEEVSEVSYNLEGKIINIIIDVKDGVEFTRASEFGNMVLEYFDEDQQSYYDLQIYLTCSENLENTIYPKIGYKHRTSQELVWTN